MRFFIFLTWLSLLNHLSGFKLNYKNISSQKLATCFNNRFHVFVIVKVFVPEIIFETAEKMEEIRSVVGNPKLPSQKSSIKVRNSATARDLALLQSCKFQLPYFARGGRFNLEHFKDTEQTVKVSYIATTEHSYSQVMPGYDTSFHCDACATSQCIKQNGPYFFKSVSQFMK